jgi:hypothetical protein
MIARLLLALLLVHLTGLPHFIASTIAGQTADCTGLDSTSDQSGHCLPLCPTCACGHLTKSVAPNASPPTIDAAVFNVSPLPPTDEPGEETILADNIFHPPRS